MTHAKNSEITRTTTPNATFSDEQPMLLDEILVDHTETPLVNFNGVFVGRLIAVLDNGRLEAEVAEIGMLCPRSMVAISPANVGCEVAIMFEQGDIKRPLIMGLMHVPASPAVTQDAVQATIDNDRILLHAEKEIVLQCGKASITLTRAGKILLRGAFISSRSSGANRIHGGSVQIN